MEKGLENKRLTNTLHTFIFPFSIKEQCHSALKEKLRQNGFEFFLLDKLDLEHAYYGDDYSVSHLRMERFYLPFTANILFPHEEDEECFQRFSKYMDYKCELRTTLFQIPFRIISVDVFLCPFQLGLITIRTEITSPTIDYSLALEFASRFRVLQDVNSKDNTTSIGCEDTEFEEVEQFIFRKLTPFIVPFLDQTGVEGAYFETLPFFVDERMYVQSVYRFEDESPIDTADLFRAAQLDGVNFNGQAYISSTNPNYIRDYCERHCYDRWSPNTIYIVNEHSFNCLTNDSGEYQSLANQMYGSHYYGMLLNLFYKIVLLKLSNQYSRISLEKDKDAIEELIRSITTFSSKYFFNELISQSQGKELFNQIGRILGNQELYADVKQTLMDLFKYQDQFSSKRQGYLLLVLTIYSVIGAIYGMNQVIEDLKGNIDWSKLEDYSVFEWIALFVTFSGIIVGFVLGDIVLKNWVKDKLKKH
ncbi:MAG: hypothetical protein K0Q81_440 [Paenibacillus sp.]|jgi:hypothetical protein|nr:hypothetical protein [Paenibacillus sp.]